MKISATLKGKADDKGRKYVYIRFNDGQKKRLKITRIKVTKEQFSKGKVIKHPQAAIYNDIIKKEIAKYELSDIKSLHELKKVDLFKYWDQCIETWRTTRVKKESSLRQYKYEKSKLERFKKHCWLSDIDRQFFIDLLKFCYEKEKNTENTAWKTFSRVHAVLEQAVVDELLPANPMDKFKKDRPVYRDPKKDHLTKDQLIAVEKFARAVDSKEQRFASLWFLIGCYTGLRFSDMVSFSRRKHIHNNRLIKENVKTGEVVSLPLTGKIKELLELVNYKPLKIQNQSYNRMLKVIADRCDIWINMTAHVSRHTAAMLLAKAGVDIGTTAKILGHSSTKHTKIYYKYANTTIDDAMDKIIK